MNDICIPISHLGDRQIAEVVVTLGGIQLRHNYRVEVFPWTVDEADKPINDTEERIDRLRNHIKNYDKSWELVQIYNPGHKAKYIHVLFRQAEELLPKL